MRNGRVALRACLVKVKVRRFLYAFSYEKAVSVRPFRCPVEPFAFVPAHPKGPGKTSYPLSGRTGEAMARRLLPNGQQLTHGAEILLQRERALDDPPARRLLLELGSPGHLVAAC